MYSVEYVNKNKKKEFLYMRHFRFFADSNYLLSIINCLKERGCIAYCKFVPDKILSKVNKDIGDYDIYIDEGKDSSLDSILSMISSHELVEMSREEYDRLVDRDCKRSYSDLVGKYKIITEERDKYVKNKLREQREEILKDVLQEYKDDIDRRISEEVDSRYSSLFDRFHKEECRVDEVCSLYKKYIDAEIKKGIEEHIERILNEDNLTKVIPYISKEVWHKIVANSKKLLDEFYYMGAYEHDAVYRDIKKFKNDLVDNFMAVSGHKRGDRDYMLFMKRAGRLADLIEGKLWEYYMLSIKDKNKEAYLSLNH